MQHFYHTAFKSCMHIVFTHGVKMVGWAGDRIKLAFQKTVRCVILGRNIGRGCRCASIWCDLGLIFHNDLDL